VASFSSEAELERINATSKELKGVLDPSTARFAFSVNIRSFIGFNSPLQMEHFNENYMESDEFPAAVFNGKIIGAIDFETNGIYEIRAKGIMDIHGTKNEEIINCQIKIENDRMETDADFTLLLSDYNISIPKVVRRKISQEIKVKVYAVLLRQ
jgi:hypothetical protein